MGVATTAGPLGESLPSPFARISWGAIFAGLFVVVAVQILLNMLGAGIGLSIVDPQSNDNGTPGTWGIAAGLWWVVSNLVALFIGGHVAARLAGSWRVHDAALHGVIVWAATLLLGAFLVASTVGSIVGGAANVLGNAASGVGKAAASAVGQAAGQTAGGFDLNARMGDLLRPTDPARMNPDQAKAELATTLPRYIAGDTTVDRNRIVQLISSQAGISPDEASARLEQWTTQARQTRQNAETQARQAADAAASTASRTALWGFAAFLLGAIAGGLGGWMGMRPEVVTVPIDAPTRRL
jgi:hypothetical protein